MRNWEAAVADPQAPFAHKSAATAFLSLLSIASKYRVNLDREIILFVKALVAVDAISLQLDPNFNLIETINAVFSKPDYAWLFSVPASSLEGKNESVAQQALESSDRAYVAKKTDQLKDYYTDWFEELLNMHEKDFLPLLHEGI